MTEAEFINFLAEIIPELKKAQTLQNIDFHFFLDEIDYIVKYDTEKTCMTVQPAGGRFLEGTSVGDFTEHDDGIHFNIANVLSSENGRYDFIVNSENSNLLKEYLRALAENGKNENVLKQFVLKGK